MRIAYFSSPDVHTSLYFMRAYSSEELSTSRLIVITSLACSLLSCLGAIYINRISGETLSSFENTLTWTLGCIAVISIITFTFSSIRLIARAILMSEDRSPVVFEF